MECPACRSKDLTTLDRWTRQCQKCGHRFPVTSHPERIPRPNPDHKEQP